MAGLRVPLSLPHPRCCHRQRRTRGRGEWLILPRTALSSATISRFNPSLSLTPLPAPFPFPSIELRGNGTVVVPSTHEGKPHARNRLFSRSIRCANARRSQPASLRPQGVEGRRTPRPMPYAPLPLTKKPNVFRQRRQTHVPVLQVRLQGESTRSLGQCQRARSLRRRDQSLQKTWDRSSLDSPLVEGRHPARPGCPGWPEATTPVSPSHRPRKMGLGLPRAICGSPAHLLS